MAFDFKNILSSLKGSVKTEGKRDIVGIDIGSSSIKVVEIEQADSFIQLKTYGELQLGPYAKAPLGSAVALPVEARTEAIVDILRESNTVSTQGVMTLPIANSFVTTISLVAQAEEDIGPRVQVEARKHVPVPLNDVELEWAEVEPLQNTPKSVREVLLAVIQKSVVAESKKILTSINMTSQQPEIELFSALRAATKESDTSLAVLDLGAKTSKLYISEGGFLRRIHRVQTGGATATERIAKELAVSFEEAENLKRNARPDSEHFEDIKKAMVLTYEKPMQEFRRVIDQYEIRSGGPLSRIVIMGGGASFYDLTSFVNYALDKQTVKTNPFTKVSYPAFMEDTLIQIAPTFAVALGAALRPFEQ